jgi:hypothetical protein
MTNDHNEAVRAFFKGDRLRWSFGSPVEPFFSYQVFLDTISASVRLGTYFSASQGGTPW